MGNKITNMIKNSRGEGCTPNSIRKAISASLVAVLIAGSFYAGQFFSPAVSYAANINGPTVVGVDTSIGAGNTCTIQVKGTYEILASATAGSNGNAPTGDGGRGGTGQSVRFTLNLNVGDILTIQQNAGGAGAEGGRKRKGSYTAIGGNGGDGGNGVTVLNNNDFLLSVQGGSGGGGDGDQVSSGASAAGGRGGTGGYSAGGTCLASPGSGGAGGHAGIPPGSGENGSNGTGLYIDTSKVSTFNMANGAYTGAWYCVLTLRSEYKNDIVAFQPISLSVKYGTTYEQVRAKLPTVIKANCTQGLFEIPVTWKCETFDQTLPGIYTFEGTLGTLPGDVKNPLLIYPIGTVTLVNVGAEQTFDKLQQIEVPKIICIAGKPYDDYIPAYDDMVSASVDGVTIINESNNDRIIHIRALFNTPGTRVLTVQGNPFIFKVVTEPDSSNVIVTFN